MGFISDYLEHTKNTESPTSFWKWSAYATISAILRDNIWKPDMDSRLYANIYAILLADSGVQRKNRPIVTCEKLIKSINNTRVIVGRNSIQSVTDELSRTTTDPKTGEIVKGGGSAIMLAPELASSIVEDNAAISVLTDIYDYKEDYAQGLRGRGKWKAEKVVFSWFGASNEQFFKKIFTSDAVYGGLLARTFLIIPDEFRPANSMLDFIDTTESFKNLVVQLRKISTLKGPITITSAGRQCYDGWYKPFRDSYKDKTDRSGVVGRIHTHVLKLAMILAADELTTELDHRHICTAIDECIALIPNYNIFVMSAGKSNISEAGSIILGDMLQNPKFSITRKDILRRYWTHIDQDTLDKLIVHFEGAGLIVASTSQDKAEGLTYTLTTKCLQMLGGTDKIQ